MKQRFDVLDIFRGLFASLVFIFHLGPFAKTPILNNEFVRNADMFVDFFFVLSGFVIAIGYQNISSLKEFGNFYKKRFLRIYPLHFIILLCFLAVELAKLPLSSVIQVNNLNNPNNNLTTFFTSLTLTNSLPIFNISDVSWNIASWSISAEMIAYLVFGLLGLSMNSLKIVKYRVLIYVTFIAVAIIALVKITGGFQLNYSFNYGFMRGLIGFFTGVLCYNFYEKLQLQIRSIPGAVFTVAEIIVIAVTLSAVCYGEELKNVGLIYDLLFFSCVFIYAFEKGIVSMQLKKIKLLQLAGKYSYSIYMTHTLLLSLFNIAVIRILKFPPSSYSYLFIINYILIFIVSAWAYKNIEMRFYGNKTNQKSETNDTGKFFSLNWVKPKLSSE